MPRAKPFTQRKIKEREKFGFGPVECGKIEQPKTCAWNFDVAIKILRQQPGNKITDAAVRARVHDEIDLLCRDYQLDCEIERQENDAAKAEAFKRARSWHKRRQPELALLRKAKESNDWPLGRSIDSAGKIKRKSSLIKTEIKFRHQYAF